MRDLGTQKGTEQKSNTERTPHYTLTAYDKVAGKEVVSSYVTDKQILPQLPVIVTEEKRVN